MYHPDPLSDLFWMERLLPYPRRRLFARILGIGSLLFLLVLFVAYVNDKIESFGLLFGSFGFILLGSAIGLLLLEIFFYDRLTDVSFSRFMAGVLTRRTSYDLVCDFCSSELGRETLVRAGVSLLELDFFCEERSRSDNLVKRTATLAATRDLFVLLDELVAGDADLALLLSNAGVRLDTLTRALSYTIERESRERWFGFLRAQSWGTIGRYWSYGKTRFLNTYEHQYRPKAHPARYSPWDVSARALETTLAFREGARIGVVGDARATVPFFEFLVMRHRVYPGTLALADERYLWLDTNRVVGRAKNSDELATLLVRLFDEAAMSGRIVLLISDWQLFEKSYSSFGLNLENIAADRWSSPRFRMIVGNPPLEMSRLPYEPFDLAVPTAAAYARALLPYVSYFEKKTKLLVTIGAIEEALKLTSDSQDPDARLSEMQSLFAAAFRIEHEIEKATVDRNDIKRVYALAHPVPAS